MLTQERANEIQAACVAAVQDPARSGQLATLAKAIRPHAKEAAKICGLEGPEADGMVAGFMLGMLAQLEQ